MALIALNRINLKPVQDVLQYLLSLSVLPRGRGEKRVLAHVHAGIRVSACPQDDAKKELFDATHV